MLCNMRRWQKPIKSRSHCSCDANLACLAARCMCTCCSGWWDAVDALICLSYGVSARNEMIKLCQRSVLTRKHNSPGQQLLPHGGPNWCPVAV